MGYTHRLVLKGSEVRSWESIVRDFRKVVSAYEGMGFKLRGPDGHGEPIINDREIRFNGDARCGHREFEFSFLPVKEKKVELPDGSVYVWTTGYYCDGDCSHEAGYLFRRIPEEELRDISIMGREDYRIYWDAWDPKLRIQLREKIDRFRGYTFWTKTQRKPYDIVLQSLFLITKHYNPDTTFIISDGDHDEWEQAQTLVAVECGYFVDPDLNYVSHVDM